MCSVHWHWKSVTFCSITSILGASAPPHPLEPDRVFRLPRCGCIRITETAMRPPSTEGWEGTALCLSLSLLDCPL